MWVVCVLGCCECVDGGVVGVGLCVWGMSGDVLGV